MRSQVDQELSSTILLHGNFHVHRQQDQEATIMTSGKVEAESVESVRREKV